MARHGEKKSRNTSPGFMIVVSQVRKDFEEMLALGVKSPTNPHEMNKKSFLEEDLVALDAALESR